ncbi:unnamed protein product [Camellia sinensis]
MKEKVALGHQETLNQSEMGFKIVSKLLLIQGTLESFLRGEGNLYSIRDNPMPEAMAELWRGMTGLDAKKQTAKVKDVLDLARCNAAEIKNTERDGNGHIKQNEHSCSNFPPCCTWFTIVTTTSTSTDLCFEIVSKLLLIQGALDSLLRGGGNLYSVQDKPMPKAMAELWRGMIGLDAKKQTIEVKDVLDLVRCNAAEIKTLKEMVTAISSKMNISVPISSHVAPGSPSPPPPLPPSICNGGGGNSGNGD